MKSNNYVDTYLYSALTEINLQFSHQEILMKNIIWVKLENVIWCNQRTQRGKVYKADASADLKDYSKFPFISFLISVLLFY